MSHYFNIYYWNNLYEMSLHLNITATIYAGNQHFGIDQNSPFITNEANTEPTTTTDGNHSYGGLLTGATIESRLPLNKGNYQLPSLHVAYLIPLMTSLTEVDMQVLLTQ